VNEEDRCITQYLGLFEIILDKVEDTGIVIGACPWCGIKLNVSAVSERHLTTAYTGPRVSVPLIVNLRGFGVECAAGDAGRCIIPIAPDPSNAC
jgi:hypothetical protein